MQALLWIAWEFSAKTTESATQKLTLQQWQVVRHGPPKTQNWAYSGLENKWTAKLEQKYLWSYSGGNLWIFIVWKFRCTKYAQVVQVNRSTVGYSGLCCCVLHVCVMSIIPFVDSTQVLQTSFRFRLLKGQRWQDNVYTLFFIGFLHTFLLNS